MNFVPVTPQTERPQFALCAPDHFDVSYRINPWMDPSTWDRDRNRYDALAREQWQGLREKLLGLGARLELVKGVPGLPDMVFTANAGVVLDRHVILPRFRHPERQGETEKFTAFFEALKVRGVLTRISRLPGSVFFEGAGDCLWDPARRMFWAGWGPRSSREAADAVGDVFAKPVTPLELVDPRFYHLDTCLRPLSRGHVLYHPPAFNDEGKRRMADAAGVENLIAVDNADACRFAVNAVNFGDDIILSTASEALRRTLETHGYRVHETPLWAFHRSGGSALCLTLRMNQTSLADAEVSASRPEPRRAFPEP